MRSSRVAIGLVLATLLAVAPVQAQTAAQREAARKFGREGIEAFRGEDYARALDRLTRAHQLVGASTTGLWRARSLKQLGRWVEASDQYLEVSRMELGPNAKESHRKAIDEAVEEREELLRAMPQVTLVGPLAADATATLDGRSLPPALLGVAGPMDPGPHVVVVKRGEAARTTRFSLEEGVRTEVELELPPAPAPSPSPAAPPPAPMPPAPMPPTSSVPEASGGDETGAGSTVVALGWVGVGLGGAALVAGTVTGILALGQQSDLGENCPDDACEPAFHDDVDAFNTMRGVSIGTLVAGGVVAVAGVTLLLTAPDAEAEVALHLTPLDARLRVEF